MSTNTKLAEALRLGREGAPATEEERLLFEAWMRGHCWALCATWDGKQYVSDAEQGGYVDPRAMNTRQIFAAWRDRAALAAHDAEQAQEPVAPHEGNEAFEQAVIRVRDWLQTEQGVYLSWPSTRKLVIHAQAAPAEQAAQAVPAGFKLVPLEPTPEMCAAGFCVSEAEHDPAGVYRAMLAAAPAAPAPEAEAGQVEPHVWLYDFMDGAETIRNWSTTNKEEAFAPGHFNQRGYVPVEN